METINMIKHYIRYIMIHRETHRRIQKSEKKRYSLSIRILMTLEYTFHDLHKIFTPKFLEYAIAYEPIILCKNLDFTKFNKVSMHDMWLVDGSQTSKNIYKHIFRLMEDNHGFNPDYLDIVADTLVQMSKHYGEDPVAVYFRNYRQFKLLDCDKYYFEKAIGIEFDDYARKVPELCVEQILLKYRNKLLNKHVVYSLMNNHNVNVLQALDLKEKHII